MFSAQLLSAVGFSTIFPFLPNYVEHLGSARGAPLLLMVTLVFSGQAVAMAVASPVWGALSDRWGRKPMVERALYGGAVLILLMGFARSAEELVVLRILQGMVTGVVSAGTTLVASVAPRERLGYAMGVMQTGLWAGVSVGPVLGGFLEYLFGYRIAFVLTAVLPGLSVSQAAVANQASTAVSNTMPAGGVLGLGITYSMYHSWGFDKGDFALAALVSGIWNNFAKLGFPVIALALLALSGDAGAALVAAAAIGIAVLAGAILLMVLVLRSAPLAARIGALLERVVSGLRRMLHRPPVEGWAAAAVRFRDQTADLLADRWLRITAATVVSHTSLYLVLLVALRHVGISDDDVSWITVLAGFSFVRLISALPITPGGAGIVELGYAAYLGIGLADPAKAQIVAAVLVFRFITYFLPIPFGAASYVIWRRNRSWRRAHDGEPNA